MTLNMNDRVDDHKKLFAAISMDKNQTERFCLTKKPSKTNKSSAPQETRKVRTQWSKEECHQLMTILESQIQGDHFVGKWPEVATKLGTGRTAKQCRDRWLNYLRPGIKKGEWAVEEERLLRSMYDSFGPKWMAMATILQNRTDNDIKNKWNSMYRREQRMQRVAASITDDSSVQDTNKSLGMPTEHHGSGAASSFFCQTGDVP